ncbi:MAG TPA: hypothetical protein VFL79_19600 [Terriglobia bacterium]|nr:hypothetical protein [Terriglobia bacterium]
MQPSPHYENGSRAVRVLSVKTPPGYEWINTKQAEKIWGRSRQAILNWCNNGTFQQFGMATRQDMMGRWFILVRIE